MKKVGEVLKTSSGGTPLKSKKEFYENGDIPWLMSGEVSQGEIFKSKNHITQGGLDGSSAKLFPVDTVLVAMYGATAGQVGILKIEASTNQAVCGVFPNEKYSPEFVYYFFLSKQQELIDQAVGNAQPNISQRKIKDVKIPVIPLPEQRRLVHLLDTAFGEIERARVLLARNLVNAGELFESRLGEVFSFGEKKVSLDQVCKIESKLVDPTGVKYKNSIHVGGGNIESMTGRFINLKSVEEEGLTSGKFEFDTNVVLYNKIRPYLVKVGLPDFPGLCSADMYPLTPDTSKITRDFLYYLLSSKLFTDYAVKGSARSGMPKVNRKHLFAFKFHLPAIKDQLILGKELSMIRKECQTLQTHYTHQLNHLTELKQSLLAKAFAGEL